MTSKNLKALGSEPDGQTKYAARATEIGVAGVRVVRARARGRIEGGWGASRSIRSRPLVSCRFGT